MQYLNCRNPSVEEAQGNLWRLFQFICVFVSKMFAHVLFIQMLMEGGGMCLHCVCQYENAFLGFYLSDSCL